VVLFQVTQGARSGCGNWTKMMEALRNDAETAADAIDEARQQLNMLYESIRDAHADGHSVFDLERATGLHPAVLHNVVDGANPPIRPTIDLL
jgi:hypothetical protein